MAIKWTTTVNKFPEIEAKVNRINGKSVSVGAKGEQAYFAKIHEYGCRISVTDKMRGWLAAHGLHLKKDTNEIIIPERSFLRAGFDECHDRIITIAERAVQLYLMGVYNENDVYKTVGVELRDAIKKYADDLKNPPKHPFTLEMNGGADNPLECTGDMIESIEYDVEG